MSQLVIGLFSGIIFGFIIQRVGATDPDRMGRAHLMQDPDIPRFMIAAVVLSAIGLFGLQAVGVGQTMILPLSLVATTLAALIFGVGWGLCGYCPGTTWAAVGEGRIDALFALIGGMFGAGLFAQMHETLIPMLYSPTNIGQITVADWVGSEPNGLLIVVFTFSAAIWIIGRVWHE